MIDEIKCSKGGNCNRRRFLVFASFAGTSMNYSLLADSS